MSRARPHRRLWLISLSFALLALAAAGAYAALGSRLVNEALDRRALRAMAEVAARTPGRAASPRLPYANAQELERLTRSTSELAVRLAPLVRFRLDVPGLTQEMLTFASAIPLDHATSNTATAYVYRHGVLGERPIVLWVPGQYVVDAASIPIGWFTSTIVARGADVVLFVPPYHLERTPPGFSSGDAVFDTRIADHLAVFAQELSDLRRLAAWLHARGSVPVGAFGGSVGAMALLRIATWERSFDFLTLFIPMLHLREVLAGDRGAPFRARLAEQGHPLDSLTEVYAALDPSAEPLRLPAERLSVLYARFDQVAPAAATEAWAAHHGVRRVFGYDRGHALALFTAPMYRDYARLLDEDLRALGW